MITDIGFGEIFAATGKVWEKQFDITEGFGRQSLCKSGKEAVIEATMPLGSFSVRHEDVRDTHLFTGGIMLVFLKERLCYDIRSFR